jgi:hypothetical protein
VLDSEEALNAAFARFKELADKKHEIFDEDLQALVSDEEFTQEGEYYKLVYSRVCSETGETPAANVTLSVDGAEKKRRGSAAGRSTRPSRRSSRLPAAAHSYCSTRSTRSPPALTRRAK